jgi:hypothetical protein
MLALDSFGSELICQLFTAASIFSMAINHHAFEKNGSDMRAGRAQSTTLSELIMAGKSPIFLSGHSWENHGRPASLLRPESITL